MATLNRKPTYVSQELAIKFFGLALPAPGLVSETEYREFIELGFASAYLPAPECCTPEVKKFLKNQYTNLNSTFWKTWEDVKSRSQEELLLYAVIHYFTTYGTDYRAQAFVPNNQYAALPFDTLKAIRPASLSEIAGKCVAILQSGIALNSSMAEMTVDFIATAIFNGELELDIDSIANREAKILIYKELRALPPKPEELLRLILFQITGNTLLIKSNFMVRLVTAKTPYAVDIVGSPDLLDEPELKKLASIFYRYKPLFLALRSNPLWKPVINRLRRMARIYHLPMKTGLMEALMDPSISGEEFEAGIEKESNIWKLFRAYNYLAFEESLANRDTQLTKVYYIRNSKVFNRTFPAEKAQERAGMATERKETVWKRILRIMSAYREASGKTTVALPADINLVVPQSEKQFLGNIPFGSYFDMATHNFVGVYWRNEWGTLDYDLSFVSAKGKKYGWDANYKNADQSLVFSGDMTTADPEATEMFYCSGELPDGFFKLNRFNGQPGTQARIFFGQQEIEELSRSYMVDPACIRFKADIFPQSRESIVGGVFGNRVYIFSGETGQEIMANNSVTLMNLCHRMTLQLPLATLLRVAGYTVLTPEELEKTQPDIDLREYTKDSLISFFSDFALKQ